MPQINESQRGLILHTLMGNKLGPLQSWEMPAIADHVGPLDISPLERFDKKRRFLVDACAAKLQTFADDELVILSSGTKIDPDEVENDWHGWKREEINHLCSREPSWISVGFGHPACLADFDYWGLMDTFSLHETLMLSVGVEPKLYDESRLLKARERKNQDELHDTIQFLIRRREVFRRKWPSLYFNNSDVPSQKIKEWLDDIEIPTHPSYRKMLDRRVANKQGVTSKVSQKPIGTQERETLLKLIAAMSCEQYGYDPKAERSEAATRVGNDIEFVGLSMDAKTVRKWLKEAAKLVDQDYWTRSE